MDIESFYEQNEARRESAEFEFGGEWTDPVDNEYELSWVEATGELYLMVEPDAVVTEDAFGDFYAHGEEVTDLTVVMRAFQLPSIDVASAAIGVAFRSSLMARPSNAAR